MAGCNESPESEGQVDPLASLSETTERRAATPDRLQAVVALHRAGLAVVGHLDPTRICAALIAELESLLPYERSLVAEVSDRDGSIRVLAHAGAGIVESQTERERITRVINNNPDGGVIRWVAANGRALRIDDTSADSRYLVGASEMRSELCVPIVHAGRVIGAINVESREPAAFSEIDEIVLSAVAVPVAVALENARLYQNVERELVERVRTEAALARSEQRYRELVEHADEGILVIAASRIDFANERVATLVGQDHGALLGRVFFDLFAPAGRAQVRRAIAATLAGAGSQRARAVAIGTDSRAWVDVTVSAIDWSGQPAALCFMSDVTEAQELTRRLTHQANHDTLTGLVNRRAFEVRLEAALHSAAERHQRHVMLYLDLDQFKVINDSCGHQAGDELLAMLSRRLRDLLRRRDTLARLGGDEFGILLEHCDLAQALRVASKIEAMFDNFRFIWEDRGYLVGASIGLVQIGNGETTVTDVLRAADAACYLAKEDGRGRVRVYRENEAAVSRRSSSLQWVNRVRHALDERRVALYYQTIAPLQHRPPGLRFEVLARLVEADGTVVSPGAFLPAVEQYDLSTAFDRYIVEQTINWLAEEPWLLAQLDLCSINLSARSLGDEGLQAAIAAAVQASGIPGNKLCFEVTETGAIRDVHASIGFMRALRKLGCRFALDDFGAGLSSFAHLRQLPVDTLKIDGTLISGLGDDQTGVALVSAIRSMAQTLGMHTVAEFASSADIVDALTEIGVDYAQGHAIARPVPIEQLRPERSSPSA